jgi:uncharacterized membrane protein YczE
MIESSAVDLFLFLYSNRGRFFYDTGMTEKTAKAKLFGYRRGDFVRKRKFYTEWAYVMGIAALALGTALMEKADFGLSMVVAPAYLVYLKLSQVWGFVTFGMAEYTLQACLLIVMVLILRRFRISYLFSFVTAVIYGFALDGCMALVALIGGSSMAWRIAFYAVGLLLCSVGVALIFRTYIAPEVYELFVKKMSAELNRNISHVKIAYDCVSCLVAIVLSFCFFGWWHFEGVKLGTVVCALVNGWLIGWIGKWMDKHLDLADALPLRCWFE